MQIAIPAILAAFIILFLHWFPWHLLRGEIRRDALRLEAMIDGGGR